jgi:hypothetical protein
MGVLGLATKWSELVLIAIQALRGNYLITEKTHVKVLNLKDEVFENEPQASWETTIGLLINLVLTEVNQDNINETDTNSY